MCAIEVVFINVIRRYTDSNVRHLALHAIYFRSFVEIPLNGNNKPPEIRMDVMFPDYTFLADLLDYLAGKTSQFNVLECNLLHLTKVATELRVTEAFFIRMLTPWDLSKCARAVDTAFVCLTHNLPYSRVGQLILARCASYSLSGLSPPTNVSIGHNECLLANFEGICDVPIEY